MLDRKKIEKRIQQVNKDHGADFLGSEPDSRQIFRHNSKAAGYLAGTANPQIRGYVHSFSSLRECRPQWRYIVSHQQQGDVAGMQLYLGFWCSTAMMWQHLARSILEKTDFQNVFASFYDLGRACLSLLDAGHADHAAIFGNTVSTHYTHLVSGTGAKPGPFDKDNVSPFFFIPGAWKKEGTDFDPDYYLTRPGYELYAQLVRIWDRPDPIEARNTFQALRDRRVSLACMSDSQQESLGESAQYSWLFYDPLLHAVNMRRIEKGLEPAPYETYITGPELPYEKIPFVEDDLLWPAYVKACGELDETPLDLGPTVKVKQDLESGMLTRVS